MAMRWDLSTSERIMRGLDQRAHFVLSQVTLTEPVGP